MRVTMGLLLMLLICAGSSSAQTVSASIQGIVTDSNGAAIVSAKVTARNIYTDASREIETDGAGRYLIPLLPPGEYEVLISAHGFKRELRQRIKLAVGQELVIDVTLSPGDIASQVNVLAEATTVNTTSAAMSGLVNDKQIRDLPLNGRSFQQLALLQTGVTPALAAGRAFRPSNGQYVYATQGNSPPGSPAISFNAQVRNNVITAATYGQQPWTAAVGVTWTVPGMPATTTFGRTRISRRGTFTLGKVTATNGQGSPASSRPFAVRSSMW